MPAADLTLREASPDEAEAIASLVNDAYGRTDAADGWTSEDGILAGPRIEPAGVEALTGREGSRLLAAERDGRLVGCVHLKARGGDAAELGLLAVRPALQGEGLGRELLAAAEAFAREALGAERIVMRVLSVREELVAWYERRGYAHTGDRRGFEPEPPQRSLVGPLSFVVLEKPLTGSR